MDKIEKIIWVFSHEVDGIWEVVMASTNKEKVKDQILKIISEELSSYELNFTRYQKTEIREHIKAGLFNTALNIFNSYQDYNNVDLKKQHLIRFEEFID